MIDLYCERTAAGLWNEPLNLVTNLAFIVAGALALRLWIRRRAAGGRGGWDLLVLVLLLFAIGIGSGLFHAYASPWSLFADVLPITLFINLYLVVFLVRVAGLRWFDVIGFFILYQACNFGLLAMVSMDALNGSVGYVPALTFLAGMWAWLAAREDPLEGTFAAACGLFVLSLTFRTLDIALCGTLTIGTHFLWHLLNGWLLYLLVAGLIRRGDTPTEAPA